MAVDTQPPAPAVAPDKPGSFLADINESLKDFKPPLDGSAPDPNPPPTKPAVPDPKQDAAPKATPSPEDAADDEILTGKRNPKSEDFKRVKTSLTTYKTEAETAKQELAKAKKELEAAIKSPKQDAGEIETLRQELAKHKAISETIGLEFNQEFQEKYDKKLKAVTDGLKTGLPADKADKIVAALSLPDGEFKRKQLAELTEGMDNFLLTEIAAANRDLRGINGERQSELSKAGQTLTELAKQREEGAKKRQTELKEAFNTALERAQSKDKGISVFQQRDGDEAWNAKVKERAAIAKVIYEGDFAHDNERADAAMWAAAAPGFLESLSELNKENTTLKETIAKMQGSNPSISSATAKANLGKPGGFLESIESELGRK